LASRASHDSSKFERGAAITLRYFLFLLAAYVVFHKVFPFGELGSRLIDLTVADFLRIVLQALVSIVGAVYLVAKSFRLPDVKYRDRLWCERLIAMTFGVFAIVVGSMVIALLERKGFDNSMARWLARGVLWAVF
jgi:H+/Cl- antiporter ClcA